MSVSDLLARFSDKKTFARGIHPPHRKARSEHTPIEVLATPESVLIPLHQHTGAPSEGVVKARTALAIGDLVGEAKGLISARTHATIDGAAGVTTASTLPNGRRSLVVPIKREAPKKIEGEESAPAPLEGRALFEEIFGGDWSLPAALPSPEEIVEAVRAAGIVGQGGAAFPTHVKLLRNPKKPVEIVLLNGCECEPYLTSDYRVMLEAPAPIIAGLRIAMHASGASEGIIAVEDNKPEAIAALKAAAEGHPGIRIVVARTKYPQGGERQLIPAVLGRAVPTGGLPLDVGVVVVNVATSAAIARAVLRGRPLTHRVVSVSGAGISRPANILVPIGVSLQALLDHCGGITPDARRVVAGGPMMGFTVADTSIPVTKGTSGITVMTAAEIDDTEGTECVRCGRCVDACPLNLMPTRLATAAKFNDLDLARRHDIMACCECGCCAYVCPARIPLAQHIRAGKLAILKQKK